MREFHLSILVIMEPDDGGFHAYAPALKGLHVDGPTQSETLSRTEEAIYVYLESLLDHGGPLPIGPGLTVEDEIDIPDVPIGAFLQNVVVPWPYQQASGVS